ncbi:hypothetical protein CMV30_18870 [Nibricoccus aquaticus]|uniref:TonB C-terminal domain-containing protein n=1 Tax=Nibricoccus aquaticus TaxID=2576891 RepID=A0A290QBE6_9BACT|nr:hypothetical protein [Nibricoccus aquaticus]ATC65844.1 hypothetical protein CMV30_18870 [Nibricoccus aquaticus]
MTQLLERSLQEQPQHFQTARTLFGAGDRGRSVQIGLVLSLIVWCGLLFLFLVAAKHFNAGVDPSTTFAEAKKPEFSIELAPEEFVMPQKEPPPPDRFVETNPDAPENVPDKTVNVGAHNQQVAQEKPTPDGKSDTPATEGKKDFESSAIVSGDLTPPEAQPPPLPPPSPEIMQAIQEAQAQREQNPLAGTEKITGESVSGYGFNIAKPSVETPTDVPKKVEGVKDAPLIVGAPQMAVPRINPQQPMPRPKINTRARPAILADNKFGTQNIGAVSFDARWSNYGQYLQQLIETVQVQWERLLRDSGAYPPSGSQVTVKFRLITDGSVDEIVSVEGSGGKQYEQICIAGITTRAPYGKWTDDMIAMLGQSQELTFTFYIQ